MRSEMADYVVMIRKTIGQTQKQFAENFGLSVRTIQDWEIGRREPGSAAQIIMHQLAGKKR